MQDNNLMSRKFILTVLVTLLTFVAFMAGRLGAEEWKMVSLIALGVYSAGNVASRWVK